MAVQSQDIARVVTLKEMLVILVWDGGCILCKLQQILQPLSVLVQAKEGEVKRAAPGGRAEKILGLAHVLGLLDSYWTHKELSTRAGQCYVITAPFSAHCIQHCCTFDLSKHGYSQSATSTRCLWPPSPSVARNSLLLFGGSLPLIMAEAALLTRSVHSWPWSQPCSSHVIRAASHKWLIQQQKPGRGPSLPCEHVDF